jgi:formylglycine-generating enzyme required for sulfatase activity
MNQILHKWPKAVFVGLGAVLLSTLAIQASDMMSGVSTQLASSITGNNSVCGPGAELIMFGTHLVCMDVFEASPSSACSYSSPQSGVETQVNVSKSSCTAVSEIGKEPWRFVTYTEANQLCARSGKRLPTAEEWYKVALGLSDTSPCLVGGLRTTGFNNCVTPTGVHDLVGNVWEWMGDTITDGVHNDTLLPEAGYIALVDGAGIVLETTDTPSIQFGEDYAWIEKSGVRGMLRGGFYGSGSDGGVFAQNMASPLNFAAAGVGFRCVKDVR